MRRGSHDDGSMVMKGGRKFKRLPMHVSMHVENEASGGLRYRVNQGADSGSCGKEEEAMFITPENQVIPCPQQKCLLRNCYCVNFHVYVYVGRYVPIPRRFRLPQHTLQL